ncbi:MAG: hypothetical protein ACK4TA_21970 [Saprospiraceae bacterium]
MKIMDTIRKLEEYCSLIEIAILEIQNQEPSSYKSAFKELLGRIKANYKSVKILLENFENNQELHFSIYLLFRSLLADLFILIYLTDSLCTDEKGYINETLFIERCKKISLDLRQIDYQHIKKFQRPAQIPNIISISYWCFILIWL